MRELYDTAFDTSSRTYDVCKFPTEQLSRCSGLSKAIVTLPTHPLLILEKHQFVNLLDRGMNDIIAAQNSVPIASNIAR